MFSSNQRSSFSANHKFGNFVSSSYGVISNNNQDWSIHYTGITQRTILISLNYYTGRPTSCICRYSLVLLHVQYPVFAILSSLHRSRDFLFFILYLLHQFRYYVIATLWSFLCAIPCLLYRYHYIAFATLISLFRVPYFVFAKPFSLFCVPYDASCYPVLATSCSLLYVRYNVFAIPYSLRHVRYTAFTTRRVYFKRGFPSGFVIGQISGSDSLPNTTPRIMNSDAVTE